MNKHHLHLIELFCLFVIIVCLLYPSFNGSKLINNFSRINNYFYSIENELNDSINENESYKYFLTEFLNIKKSLNDFCESIPLNLLGKLDIEKILNTSIEYSIFSDDKDSLSYNMTNISFMNNLELGGSWKPANCKARHRVAIVIPYKDRLENLKTFLFFMHPLLQRQELDYTIYVVEQANSRLFNKGILMNVGFKQAFANNSRKKFDCIIFHDVDLIPTDDLNLYTCPKQKPRHLSILVGQNDFRISHPILVGGVMIYKYEHFMAVNGYSNIYWGWGAEDDDMYYRLVYAKVGIERPARNTKYLMLKHKRGIINHQRYNLLQSAESRMNTDGLNNIEFSLIHVKKLRLFTHVLIIVGKNETSQDIEFDEIDLMQNEFQQEILNETPNKNTKINQSETNEITKKTSQSLDITRTQNVTDFVIDKPTVTTKQMLKLETSQNLNKQSTGEH